MNIEYLLLFAKIIILKKVLRKIQKNDIFIKEVKIMRDSRIEKLARNLLNHSINLQKGEKILIEIIGTDAIT